jgi:hypothetical protein
MDVGAPLGVTIATVPVTAGPGVALPATLAPGGCAVAGTPVAGGSAATDVVAGLFTSVYNGGPLAAGGSGTPGDGTQSGVHAIVEDRACALGNASDVVPPGAGGACVCVFHPWGVDTNVTVAAPAAGGGGGGGGGGGPWFAAVFARRGSYLGSVGPLATAAAAAGTVAPDGAPALLVVPWVREGWLGDGLDYAWLYVVYQASG